MWCRARTTTTSTKTFNDDDNNKKRNILITVDYGESIVYAAHWFYVLLMDFYFFLFSALIFRFQIEFCYCCCCCKVPENAIETKSLCTICWTWQTYKITIILWMLPSPQPPPLYIGVADIAVTWVAFITTTTATAADAPFLLPSS